MARDDRFDLDKSMNSAGRFGAREVGSDFIMEGEVFAELGSSGVQGLLDTHSVMRLRVPSSDSEDLDEGVSRVFEVVVSEEDDVLTILLVVLIVSKALGHENLSLEGIEFL